MSEEAKSSGGAAAPSAAEANANTRVFDDLYAKIHAEVLEGDFDIGDAAEVANRAMEFLNKYPDMPGKVKRDMVPRLVRKLIADIPMDEGLRAGLLVASNALIPKLVEIIYKAWMKKFDLNGDGKITLDEYEEVCCGCYGKKKK